MVTLIWGNGTASTWALVNARKRDDALGERDEDRVRVGHQRVAAPRDMRADATEAAVAELDRDTSEALARLQHTVDELQHTLRDALDQLKLSIDAINLPAGDVAALLANLRYRLEPRLKAAGIERIALVTHAWHMVRATRDFERAGLQVLPAPTGFKGGQARKLYRLLPRASALADSSLALHEWLGILAQHWSLDR